MKIKRLQGKEFQAVKKLLTMVEYDISNNGNVRAVMKYKIGTGAHWPGRISHWLNEYELKKFMNSEYFKTHEPTSGSKESLNTREWSWTNKEN